MADLIGGAATRRLPRAANTLAPPLIETGDHQLIREREVARATNDPVLFLHAVLPSLTGRRQIDSRQSEILCFITP